jgi:hypothetical protein
MRTKLIRLSALFAICLASTPLIGWSQTVSAAPRQARKQQGFFDYALDKVNPSGKDYGSSLQGGRDALVSNTVDDLYFWSNVLTLLLLTGAAVTILLQMRSTQKRDVIAASLIAELWNGRVSDRIELDRRTTLFNELVEAHNSEVEKALALKALPSGQANEAPQNLTRSVQRLAGKGTPEASQDASRRQGAGPTSTPPAADSTVLNLKESNLLLQRQVEAMQNNEQNLKQRLNQTTLLLDQERRRNATLKGA